MLEKWTNTSSPCSREMKPKPFSALKNFTVPVAIAWTLLWIRASPHDPVVRTSMPDSGADSTPGGELAICVGHEIGEDRLGIVLDAPPLEEVAHVEDVTVEEVEP